MRIALSLVLLIVATVHAATPTAPAKIAGTYTSLSFNTEAGDLTGWEVTLIPQSDGSYFALVQLSEGAEPTVATARATVSGASISFLIAGRSALSGNYSATIGATELLLRTPQGDVEHLKRARSYWK
jgi:hypothetical protein